MYVMRQTASMVVFPITVNNFASLFILHTGRSSHRLNEATSLKLNLWQLTDRQKADTTIHRQCFIHRQPIHRHDKSQTEFKETHRLTRRSIVHI